jgi:hypothetical protein
MNSNEVVTKWLPYDKQGVEGHVTEFDIVAEVERQQ